MTTMKLEAITMAAVPITSRPDGEWLDMPGARHYRVTLTYQGRCMETTYSMGSGLRGVPERDDVLESLFLDAPRDGTTFEEWCRDFDYDTDSRKAEKLFHACQEIGQELHALLGDDFDAIHEEVDEV